MPHGNGDEEQRAILGDHSVEAPGRYETNELADKHERHPDLSFGRMNQRADEGTEQESGDNRAGPADHMRIATSDSPCRIACCFRS